MTYRTTKLNDADEIVCRKTNTGHWPRRNEKRHPGCYRVTGHRTFHSQTVTGTKTWCRPKPIANKQFHSGLGRIVLFIFTLPQSCKTAHLVAEKISGRRISGRIKSNPHLTLVHFAKSLRFSASNQSREGQFEKQCHAKWLSYAYKLTYQCTAKCFQHDTLASHFKQVSNHSNRGTNWPHNSFALARYSLYHYEFTHRHHQCPSALPQTD